MNLEADLLALIRPLVAEEVRRALAERNGDLPPWLTVEAVAEMLGVTPAAIHSRLAQGWMAHARIKEGRRVLIETRALLLELQQKKDDNSR